MNRIAKTIVTAAIVIITFALGGIAGALVMQHHHTAPAATVVHTVSDNVSSFNDGFADSKADDCQQGFTAACQWANAK